MNKAVFLDRDGTINVEKNYLYKVEDFEFLPGVIDGLKLLQKAGFLLIVITNQSGIARGYYTEDDLYKLNNWMITTLKEQGVTITEVYYCPHLPDAPIDKYRKDCNCRKPQLGMYEQAILEHNIELSKSFAIGDKIRDCSICKNTSCHGFLIENTENKQIIDGVKKGLYHNVSYAQSLLDCVPTILEYK